MMVMVELYLYYLISWFSIKFPFTNCQTSTQLVKEYINHVQPMSCTFLGDWSINDMRKLVKEVNVALRFWRNQMFLSDNEKLETKYNNMLFVLKYCCNETWNVLHKASKNGELTYKRKWLILTNLSNYNIHNILDRQFGNIALRFDSDVKVATFSSSLKTDRSVFLYDIYNTGFEKNGSFVSKLYGYWNSSKGSLVFNESSHRYREKYVLTGVTLKSSTVLRTNTDDSDLQNCLTRRNPVDMISKFGYSIFVHFMEMHNFTHVQINRDKWFGNDLEGLDDGVAKDLYEEIVDLSSTVCLIKISRLGPFDYLNPMYRFSSVFIFRNRGSHNLWQNEFLKPFTTSVWITMLIILILLSIALKLINWTEVNYLRSIRSYSSITAILITISIICQQGSPFLPRHITSRFLFIIILTLSFILYNYYTSSIVSALLNSKPKELTTFRDLIRSGLQLGIQMAPYTLTIFETNMNEDVQTIKGLVFPEKEKPHVWNMSEGLEKVRTGPNAYHAESGAAYALISKTFDSQAVCELSDNIALIPPSLLTFWMKKDAQYRNLMKLSLRRMEEVGLVRRNRKIWEREKPPCLANAIVLSVGLDQTFIAFFLLTIGYFISCSIMILELWHVKYSKKKQHKQ